MVSTSETTVRSENSAKSFSERLLVSARGLAIVSLARLARWSYRAG
jgi:hypothetical protein